MNSWFDIRIIANLFDTWHQNQINMGFRYSGHVTLKQITHLEPLHVWKRNKCITNREKHGCGCQYTLVTPLSSDFTETSHNITCDNYFTDPKLAEALVKHKLSVVGTVRRNETFLLPMKFQQKKAHPLEESKFLFRHQTQL